MRSGTTFVGQALSFPLVVDYIHEPYLQKGIIPNQQNRRYPYVRSSFDTEDMLYYHEYTKRLFNYDINFKGFYPQKDPWLRKIVKRIVGSRGPFYLRLAKLNIFHQAAVIKDVVGLFLCEYLYLHFQVKPVIVIRHPTSLIASLKRVNWRLHPRELYDEYLIVDYFQDESNYFNTDWSNLVLEAAAFWRCVHKVLLAQAKKYPDWQVITHEKLCEDPVSNFHHLYQVLDLPWSESVKRKIVNLTQNNNPVEAKKGRVQALKRNSAEIFNMRRNSLSLEERRVIFETVKDIALQIYDRESFAIN